MVELVSEMKVLCKTIEQGWLYEAQTAVLDFLIVQRSCFKRRRKEKFLFIILKIHGKSKKRT